MEDSKGADLDRSLPADFRTDARAVVEPTGETVDVDHEWAKYVADRADKLKPVSAADWRGWILKAIGFARRERQRGPRRALPPGQRTGTDAAVEASVAAAGNDF